MDKASRIFVAGHRGLVGSAISRRLHVAGFGNLVERARGALDLRDPAAVEQMFATERPEYVFLAAAVVGGIKANDSRPAEFIRDNLAIQTNIIHSAWKNGTRKLLFLGSSCIYPKLAPQPLREDYLLTGPLEPTNQWYAVAKIAGIKMCQAYRKQYGFDAIAAMPTNLYGPGDNFDLQSSHVLPALMRKVHEARESGAESVTVWGTGTPRREFLHVDDMADACLFLMEHYSDEGFVNVGWGEDVSIAELARLVCEVEGFRGRLEFDATKPDGTPRKLLDTTLINSLGWRPSIRLRDGIDSTYAWYKANVASR
jgi:GDP-L-fucose synthase